MNANQQTFEKHIKLKAAGTVLDVLAAECPLSRRLLKQAMQKGCVWITHGQYTQRIRRAKKIVASGDQLHIYYNGDVLNQQPLKPLLVEDCDGYSVWYKPYGVYSQGSRWGDHCTINRLVQQQTGRPAFIVNRLDRAATGLILIAHTKHTAAALANLFQQRAIVKRYRVIVHGRYPDTEQILDSRVNNRPALSKALLIDYDGVNNRSLLELDIATGRKHQIRVHLSDAGYPVLGDRLHGAGTDQQDLQLCSCYLAFTCPVNGRPVQFTLDESLQPAL